MEPKTNNGLRSVSCDRAMIDTQVELQGSVRETWGPFVGQISWSGFWGAATELPDHSSLQDWGVTEDNAMAVMMQVEFGR